LIEKKGAIRAQRARIDRGEGRPKRLEATVTAVGRAGVRKIEIRGHNVLADSGPDTGGYDLGPSPVEYLLGSLGSCLAHTFMVHAAMRDVEIDELSVTVTAVSDPRGGHPAHPTIVSGPTNLNYQLNVQSPAPPDEIACVFEAAEKACPVTRLLSQPQEVRGHLEIRNPALEPVFAGYSRDALLP
jgi:uncharacterized OsmC-like protein